MPRQLLFLVGAYLFSAAAGAAEVGEIQGSVRDETGAALPGVTVTATGAVVRHAISERDGGFRLGALPAGNYRITARLVGFATLEKSGLAVVPGAVLDLPLALVVALRGEDVVVSASKIESELVNAPATVSVVSAETIAASPAQNYGDLLRSVPGLNVIQTSVRDVNLSSRQATSTLANSQLVVLDGRSIYLDFFGIVLWDFVPVNPDEIQQIEVVHGPASAVWGANAMTGVVNILTKLPRSSTGFKVGLTAGLFGRACDNCSREDGGASWGGNLSYAGAPSSSWSYRMSAGYFTSEPYSRPTGRIPVIPDPRIDGAQCDTTTGKGDCVGGAEYPADKAPDARSFGSSFTNTGTRQPKVDLRVDQELPGGLISYSGGYAGTDGIIHTGIGPFDIQNGSYMAYGRIAFSKGAFRLSGFANLVDVKAPNLMAMDPATARAVELDFRTVTYDLEAGHSLVVRDRHVLAFGGNARRNNFDITLAPHAQDRTEVGFYVQDHVFFEHVRLALGARADKFDNLDHWVYSPRLAVILKPAAAHSIRFSFNKAFRSASAINNSLDQAIVQPITLPDGQSFPLVVRSVGSDVAIGDRARPELNEESVTAYEIGYTGTFNNRTTTSLVYYVNDTDNNINFTKLPNDYDPYSPQNPPPGWPLPPGVLAVLAQQGIYLPRTAYTYMNLGPIRQRGFEVAVDHAVTRKLSFFANYSWQAKPQVLHPDAGQQPYPIREMALPPKSRFNLGVNWNGDRFFANASLFHCDKTFWADVLTDGYAGYTDAFTLVNAAIGVRFAGGKVTTSLKATNLLNRSVREHVFGDVLKRSVVAELRVRR